MPVLRMRIAVTDSLLADEVRGKITGTPYRLKAEACHELTEYLFNSPHLKIMIVHDECTDTKYMECSLVVGEEHVVTRRVEHETDPRFY